MRLSDWLLTRAREALARQRADGSLPPGCNGPYGHAERPVRNTAHALVLWAHAWTLTRDPAFESASRRAADYILGPADRPGRGNHLHRTAARRDRCNGTIGAAWVIEGLTAAHHAWSWNDCLATATNLFLRHPQDARHGIWFRLEPDSRILPVDKTFNHQLWFAYAGSLIDRAGHSGVRCRILRFLDRLPGLFAVDHDGLIRHRLVVDWKDRVLGPGTAGGRALETADWLLSLGRRRRPDRTRRDIGYHAFNLHAFAGLHAAHPRHPFWTSPALARALDFLSHPRHTGALDGNPYAYPYNPVGFEAAFALQVFQPERTSERRDWIRRQIHALGGEYGSATDDPETARLRAYEACGLDDVEL